jgi:hypothetical protein
VTWHKANERYHERHGEQRRWHELEDYAKQLSPRFTGADEKLTAARRDHNKAEAEQRAWQNQLGRAEDGADQRQQHMGWLGRVAHQTGIFKDRELAGYERQQAHATDKLHELDPIMRQRERELDKARDEYVAAQWEVRPAAEKALAKDWERARAQNEQEQEQEQAAQRQKSGWDLGR